MSKEWKIGNDMVGRSDRSVIEKTIRNVMGLKGESMENANNMKMQVEKLCSKVYHLMQCSTI